MCVGADRGKLQEAARTSSMVARPQPCKQEAQLQPALSKLSSTILGNAQAAGRIFRV